MIHRALMLLALLLVGTAALAAGARLTVAISPDIPPYVMRGASAGLEVDMLRDALPGHALRFVQMPYARIATAIQRKQVDVAAGVQGADSSVYYSHEFVRFVNYAISKRADGLRIDRVADLKGHPVLAWQGAYRVLGPAFERQYAPGSPQRALYHEIPDQREQVRRFWQTAGSVIVIDRAIFRYVSKAMDHRMAEVDLHELFPPATGYKVGFRDAALRDLFDRNLARLCRSGQYAKLLDRYGIGREGSVCPG